MREPDGHTLSPTALVHEAYMRLIDYSRMEFNGRAHFLLSDVSKNWWEITS